MFFVLASTFIAIPFFDLKYILYYQIYFDSFIPVIMLNKLRLKSSVLFGTHTFFDKSLRVLQLPTHSFILTANH